MLLFPGKLTGGQCEAFNTSKSGFLCTKPGEVRGEAQIITNTELHRRRGIPDTFSDGEMVNMACEISDGEWVENPSLQAKMNISDKVCKAAKRQYEENNMNEKTKIEDENSDVSKEDVDPGRDGLLEEAKEPCLRDEVTELKTAEERLWNPIEKSWNAA